MPGLDRPPNSIPVSPQHFDKCVRGLVTVICAPLDPQPILHDRMHGWLCWREFAFLSLAVMLPVGPLCPHRKPLPHGLANIHVSAKGRPGHLMQCERVEVHHLHYHAPSDFREESMRATAWLSAAGASGADALIDFDLEWNTQYGATPLSAIKDPWVWAMYVRPMMEAA